MTIRRISIRRYGAIAALALLFWFAGLAVFTLIREPTDTVIVFAPGDRAIDAAIAADTEVLDAGSIFVRVRSERTGFVRRLYAAGAWLVWPALDLSGCFS